MRKARVYKSWALLARLTQINYSQAWPNIMRFMNPLLNIAIVLAALLILSACGEKQAEPQVSEVPASTHAEEAPAVLGASVYQQVCMACHDAGVMEAPKFGNAEHWAELIEEGYGVLVYESIKGEGNMPPRGGNPALTDMEVAHAVAYLANSAGAGFVAPKTKEDLQSMLQTAEQEVEHEHEHE